MFACELIHENPKVYRIQVPFSNVVTNETNCFVVVDGSDALVIDTGAPGAASARGADGDASVHRRRLAGGSLFSHAHALRPFGAFAVRGTARCDRVRQRARFPFHPAGFGDGLAEYACRRFQEEGITGAAACSASAAIVVSTELDLTGYALTLVDEGSEIRVGRHVFKVISTPGHTVGHMALYEERSGICFTGDHVLFVITPGLALRFGEGNALTSYIDSLKKISALSCSRLFISHGECRLDFEDRIEHLIEHHERRCLSLEQIIAEADPRRRGLTGMRSSAKSPAYSRAGR